MCACLRVHAFVQHAQHTRQAVIEHSPCNATQHGARARASRVCVCVLCSRARVNGH